VVITDTPHSPAVIAAAYRATFVDVIALHDGVEEIGRPLWCEHDDQAFQLDNIHRTDPRPTALTHSAEN
jgi:hypothetical protein